MGRKTAVVGILALLTTACGVDSARAPLEPTVSTSEVTGKGVFKRYVAVGTSVSMGWSSDGVYAPSQLESWPAQLAQLSGNPMSLPLISGTGCRAPFAAPLISFVRISGESVLVPSGSLLCAPLVSGIQLPAQNVAISGARTLDALSTTPGMVTDPFYAKLYPLILPPNTTQVQAMEMQNPRFVSVEFGANEVLGAISGVVIPGGTVVPVAVWQPIYSALLDRVGAKTSQAVLVGLIHNAASFVAFRRGWEIWADRVAFLSAFNVAVQPDCQANRNLLFVPVLVPRAVAAGLTARQGGQGPVPFSCAAGSPTTPDNILSASEEALLNDLLLQMNKVIAAEAKARGFAHFELEALYGRTDLKPPFSVVNLMTSAEPYGPYMGLEGVHPNRAGHAVLASAAARAINAKYDFGLPIAPSVFANR